MAQDADECTVMVRNLPLDLLGPELESIFAEVGPVKKAAVIHHKKIPGVAPTSRGFGFVKFALPEDCLDSITQLNGTRVRGRALKLEHASKKKKQGGTTGQSREVEGGGTSSSSSSSSTTTSTSTSSRSSSNSSSSSSAPAEPVADTAGPNDGGIHTSSTDVAVGGDTATVEREGGVETETRKGKGKGKGKASASPEVAEITVQHPAKVRTLRLFGIAAQTSQKQLLKRLQKMGTVENLDILQDGEDGVALEELFWPRGRMAKVTFSTLKDATKAMGKLDRHSIHGSTLAARFDVHVLKGERAARAMMGSGGAPPKAGRVIVRNLSFKATEKDIADVFLRFGPLSDVHIPTVTMPRHFNPQATKQQSRGFGFLQFVLQADARKAVEGSSGLVVCDREVAVDFSQAKKVYEAGTAADVEPENQDSDQVPRDEKDSDDDQTDEDENDDETDDDEEEEEGGKEKGAELAGQDGAMENSDDDSDDDDEDSDDVEEKDDDDDDDDDDEQEEDDADQEDQEKKGGGDEKSEKVQKSRAEMRAEEKPRQRVSKDILEKRTVFVKNLSFEVTKEDLRHRFEEFGAIERTVIVTDRETGLARGTGFVTFEATAAAAAAVARATRGLRGAGNPFKLLERNVEAMVAVDRGAAKEFGKEGRDELKKKRDRRNMYLKDEGLVSGVGAKEEGKERHSKKKKRNKGPDNAATCPAGDLEKRQAAHREKKKKLQNPLFFISPTRLSVRNIARKVDDAALRKTFSDAAREGLRLGLVTETDVRTQLEAHATELNDARVGGGAGRGGEPRKPLAPKVPSHKLPVKVGACRIIRDLERTDAPSRGYGFVEFQSHAHALAALRWTNNNPAFSTLAQGGEAAARAGEDERPRLIVEFSVENKGKLQIQEKRRETSQKREDQRKNMMAAEHVHVDGDGDDASGDVDDSADGRDDGGAASDAPKKLSRGQRQREKRRQRRELLGDASDSNSRLADTEEAEKKPRAPHETAALQRAKDTLKRRSEVGTNRQKKEKKRARLEKAKAEAESADPEIDAVIGAQKKRGAANNDQESKQTKKKKKKKAQENGGGGSSDSAQNFDAMVSEYKNRLFSSTITSAGPGDGKKDLASRWFD